MKDPATTALEALGHVKVPNARCTARYKDSAPTLPGPRNPPVWCDLKDGHEGPHRHVTGHRSFIMDRVHLIEMPPLPDLCEKCGTRWPCKDAEAVINAFTCAEVMIPEDFGVVAPSSMMFTSEDFIASIREMYQEWQEMKEQIEGDKTSLPDFEYAIDHFARHGMEPLGEEA